MYGACARPISTPRSRIAAANSGCGRPESKNTKFVRVSVCGRLSSPNAESQSTRSLAIALRVRSTCSVSASATEAATRLRRPRPLIGLTPVARLARHLAMDRMGSRLEKVVPISAIPFPGRIKASSLPCGEVYDYILPYLDLRQEIGAFIHHEFPHGLASGR